MTFITQDVPLGADPGCRRKDPRFHAEEVPLAGAHRAIVEPPLAPVLLSRKSLLSPRPQHPPLPLSGSQQISRKKKKSSQSLDTELRERFLGLILSTQAVIMFRQAAATKSFSSETS